MDYEVELFCSSNSIKKIGAKAPARVKMRQEKNFVCWPRKTKASEYNICYVHVIFGKH
jgi:hypothetical protein